jgi:hypothetical protein
MRFSGIALSGLLTLACLAETLANGPIHYKVLPPIRQGNITIFPVTADKTFATNEFITLDEGIRSGSVHVSEMGSGGIVRRRPATPGVWNERRIPIPESRTQIEGARVNSLALINDSDRPLILLAGEIVTGGKQDRVVGKDRIIPAHSQPVALDVFCVEPHRWVGASLNFDKTLDSMAQPSVRSKAMALKDQSQVWDQVATSREALVSKLPAPQAHAILSSSSYAAAVESDAVKSRLESVSAPLQKSYEKLISQLKSANAVGAVVSIDGQIIWADVFGSSALLEKYWPKLVRSYAAESFGARIKPTGNSDLDAQKAAQAFLDRLDGRHESIETEPNLYRNTEIHGDNFEAFLLTSLLLPGTSFPIHLAKMLQ